MYCEQNIHVHDPYIHVQCTCSHVHLHATRGGQYLEI